MLMKYKYIFFVAILLSLIHTGTIARAEEQTYIVKVKTVDLMGCSNESPERDHLQTLTQSELDKYINLDMVEDYEPNHKVKLHSVENHNWNLDVIKSEYSHSLGCYGNNVKVAVIDSGIQPIEDLSNVVCDGFNYLRYTTDTFDNIGHGTFVSGIIASENYGVAYRTQIVPLKCFDNNIDTYVDDVIDAIYDAVDVYSCDVINMSFGFTDNSKYFERAVKYAVNHGVIVVASVGNDGTSSLYYPAAYDDVIGVGALNSDLTCAGYSQKNNSVFVTAPGSDLDSVRIDGYADKSGTSFSAPHISAVAAIVKSIDKTVTNNKVKEILQLSSTDLGEPGYDISYGFGLLNTQKLFDILLKDTKTFVSPIDETNQQKKSVIFNNTNDEKSLSVIYGIYDEFNKLIDLKIENIILASREKFDFSLNISGYHTKLMVWNDINNMQPQANVREIFSERKD